MSPQRIQPIAAMGTPIPRAVLANLEAGRRADVTVDELYAFAAVLETSADYLATSVGPSCNRCQDTPPAGFSCMACGRKGEVTEAS
jgi:hypothetical protein